MKTAYLTKEMGPKKVPTDSVPEFEWGRYCYSRYSIEEKGGCKGKGGRGTETEGGGRQEEGGKNQGNTLSRGGSCGKKAQDREN